MTLKFPFGFLQRMLAAAMLIACAEGTAHADSYYCRAVSKYGSDGEYSQETMARYQFSVRVDVYDDESSMRRCSFETKAGEVTCDQYEIDHVYMDPSGFGGIKFYDFEGQWDVQIFSDMAFVENNGRGVIVFGRCESVERDQGPR